MSISKELENFDWKNHKNNKRADFKFEQKTVAGNNLPLQTRKELYINQLYSTCMLCSICDVGCETVGRDGIYRDPHLLSNHNISNIMLVSNHPTYEDLYDRDNCQKSGKLISKLVNVNIDQFLYITYLAKCCNDHLAESDYQNCTPYLELEINLLSPPLIITMGQRAYDYCKATGSLEYGQAVMNIVGSKFDSKLLPICGLDDENFDVQLCKVSKLLNKLIKRNGKG